MQGYQKIKFNKLVKRLFIFAGYDKFQRVDDTLLYYLNSLSALGDIVFNMDNDLPDEELSKITAIPNMLSAAAHRHGEYDFGSYKRGYIWARDNKILDKYDWVYLVNDSVFGPAFDLAHTLGNLESGGADFVGMVCNTTPNIAPHIQSWFVGVCRNIALSAVLHDFITSVRAQSDISAVIGKYEIGLTTVLEQHGYKYTTVFNDATAKMYWNPIKIIRGGVPFIKKKSLPRVRDINHLYKILPPQLAREIGEYAVRYDVDIAKNECVYRLTVFGAPVVSIYQRKHPGHIIRKTYLFGFIPIRKTVQNC